MAGFSLLMLRRFGVILFLLLAVANVHAASMTAALERQSISLGESTTLRLRISDAQPNQFPTIPPVANLQIQPQGNELSTTIINGRSQTTFVFTYSVTASQEGEFTIPPVQIVVNGQPLTSNPVKLTVAKAVQSSSQQQEGAFLRMTVPKKELFIGEPMIVELLLYFQDAKDLKMPQIQAEGFLVGQMQRPTQTRTQLRGVIYNVLVFRTVVTPIKSGNIKLGPATSDLVLLFGPVDFFGRHTRGSPATLTAEAVDLLVHALPEQGKPESFTGAVGKYQVQFTAGPTNLAAGDPITVRTRISGSGNLDTLTLPEQTAWRDFKTYPATTKIETTDPMGLEGVKTFEQVISPVNGGVKELPGLVFSYFDPEAKRYQTVRQPPLRLNVAASAAAPSPTILADTNQPVADATVDSKELAHIKPHLGLIHSGDGYLLQKKWFLALQALAPILFGAAFVRRKQKEHLAANPALIRKRAVIKTVDEGIVRLRELAGNNNREEFFLLLFKLLQEQIGERLDLPASGITEESIESLSKLGLKDDARAELHKLFQAANQARYAGSLTTGQLQEIAGRAETALRQVRDLRKVNES